MEDDPAIRVLTAAFLKYEFDVFEASNAAEAQGLIASGEPDLILLDLGLPDEDGFVLARQIRSRSATPPIIFVTSRDSTVNKIEGLNVGGDDYVTKPFDPDELIARINAVLRRANPSGDQGDSAPRIKIGFIEIDLGRRQIWDAQGDLVKLTRAEFNVLLALVNANGRVLSRSNLLDAISTDPDHDATDRTIDAIVSKIRKKLVSDQTEEKIIVTVQGLGYQLGAVRS